MENLKSLEQLKITLQSKNLEESEIEQLRRMNEQIISQKTLFEDNLKSIKHNSQVESDIFIQRKLSEGSNDLEENLMHQELDVGDVID